MTTRAVSGKSVTVVVLVCLVASAKSSDHGSGGAFGQVGERRAGRANLIPRRLLDAHAHEHRIRVRDQLEWIGHREQGTPVKDHEIVCATYLLEELPEPLALEQLRRVRDGPSG